MHRLLKVSAGAAAAAALLTVAACSPDAADFKDEAEAFIEDDEEDVAQQSGLTFDDAACEEPPSKDVGSTFTCTAVGSDGTSYTFTAEITGEREFQLTSVDVAAGATPTESAPPTS
jgi:hypothetical protein